MAYDFLNLHQACGDKTCKGTAIPTAKDGRFYFHPKHDWLRILIPSTFLIHRCNVCNTDWLYGENHKKIPEYLEASYQEHAIMIRDVVDEYRAKMKREAAEK